MNVLENRKIQEQKLTDSSKDVDDRRKKVHSLDLQGYTNKEIAEKMGTSESTVEKDLHQTRNCVRNWFSELGNVDRYQAFVDAVLQVDQVLKELWQMARNEKDAAKKSRILNNIADNAVKKANLFKTSEAYLTTFYFKQKDLSEKELAHEKFLESLTGF